MSKQKNQQMHKLVCLCNLLLENLDDLKVTKPTIVKFKEDLIRFCELLNNEIKDTSTIQKGTYFQELSNKINTIIRKNYDENM